MKKEKDDGLTPLVVIKCDPDMLVEFQNSEYPAHEDDKRLNENIVTVWELLNRHAEQIEVYSSDEAKLISDALEFGSFLGQTIDLDFQAECKKHGFKWMLELKKHF